MGEVEKFDRSRRVPKLRELYKPKRSLNPKTWWGDGERDPNFYRSEKGFHIKKQTAGKYLKIGGAVLLAAAAYCTGHSMGDKSARENVSQTLDYESQYLQYRFRNAINAEETEAALREREHVERAKDVLIYRKAIPDSKAEQENKPPWYAFWMFLYYQ